MERQPILADAFYAADPAARAEQIAALSGSDTQTRERALVVVLPQGALSTTGAIAEKALSRIVVPELVIVLAAAHAGHAPRGALFTLGAMRLPGVRIPIDTRFAEELAGLALLQEDSAPHVREHAIEAVLPLLHHHNPRIRVVPVVLGAMTHPTSVRIGNALADCIQNHGRDALVVVATSLAAYLPSDRVQALDARALARMSALDGAGLYELVNEHPEAMDGVAPVSVALAAARALGRTSAEVVEHAVRTPNIDRGTECVGNASLVVW